MITALAKVKGLIIDMDGVLWHGSVPMPGLLEFFQILREREIRFILATNNAGLTPGQYVAKLGGMGVAVKQEQILTSGLATALHLSQRVDPANTKVFVIGEEGASVPLLERGFSLAGLYDQTADIVVCGKDQTLTWDKLATASLNLRAGAEFIGTNPDTTLPTERGVILGNGAILAALQVATGVAPTIVGKPGPIMYRQAMALLGTEADNTVAIGDRLETDILGAVRAGIRSIMVLSGISSAADLRTSEYQPTWVLPDIRAITQAIQANPHSIKGSDHEKIP